MSSASTTQRLWYLNQFELFSELTEQDIENLSGITTYKTFAKTEAIYFPGDQASTIYVLVEGKVRISQMSDDGREATLAILGPGDIFGELALLTPDEIHEGIAQAMEACVVCHITREAFEGFLIQRPALNLRVTKLMGLRMRRIENTLYNLIFKDTYERLKILLAQLAKEYGKPCSAGTLIDIKLNHQDLGNLINASRPTVSIHLGQMKTEGLVIMEGHKLIWLQ